MTALPRAPEGVELRHLRAFVAVAEELNFGRAAQRLYLSQPALSRQIRALEVLLGCDLLRRSTHNVELTLAGHALLDRARDLLQGVDEAISATQSVGGELAARVAGFWEPLAEVSGPDTEIETMRAEYEQLHAKFAPPADVSVAAVNARGVPGFTVLPEGGAATEVLYLHGGGYIIGSAYGFRHLGGAIAAATGSGVLVAEYRLAPEHPYPAALDDAAAAYRWLLDRIDDPRRLVVAGDSTGAGLALSLLLLCRQESLPQPGCAVLFSPSVDLTGTTLDAAPSESGDIRVVRALWQRAAAAYGGDPSDPLLDPLHTDLTGLPPLLVQAASGDHALEDARLLAEHARACGVDTRLELFPGTTHAFQMFWSFLPEAAQAMEQAGEFVTDVRDRRRATGS